MVEDPVSESAVEVADLGRPCGADVQQVKRAPVSVSSARGADIRGADVDSDVLDGLGDVEQGVTGSAPDVEEALTRHQV